MCVTWVFIKKQKNSEAPILNYSLSASSPPPGHPWGEGDSLATRCYSNRTYIKCWIDVSNLLSDGTDNNFLAN